MKNHHLTALLLVLAWIVAGCGNPKALKTTAKSFDCIDEACTKMFEIKPQKTEVIIAQRQIVSNYQKCLNLSTAQILPAAKAAFKDTIAAYSMDGNARDISAPMLVGIAKVAGEMCLSMLEVEKNAGSRRFFPGYDLGSGAGGSSPSADKSINELAGSCWGRDANAAELNLIKTSLSSSGIAAQTGRSAALFMCTTILSSTQAIRF